MKISDHCGHRPCRAACPARHPPRARTCRGTRGQACARGALAPWRAVRDAPLCDHRPSLKTVIGFCGHEPQEPSEREAARVRCGGKKPLRMAPTTPSKVKKSKFNLSLRSLKTACGSSLFSSENGRGGGARARGPFLSSSFLPPSALKRLAQCIAQALRSDACCSNKKKLQTQGGAKYLC